MFNQFLKNTQKQPILHVSSQKKIENLKSRLIVLFRMHCKFGKTVIVFILTRTVTDFYYFKEENITILLEDQCDKNTCFSSFWTLFWEVPSCTSSIIFWDMINQHIKTLFLQIKKTCRVSPISVQWTTLIYQKSVEYISRIASYVVVYDVL